MPNAISISPELKPLLADLKRLRIGQYLNAEEFKLLVLENDWDALWKECYKEARRGKVVVMLGHVSIEDQETALGHMLDAAYNQAGKAGLFEMLSIILEAFAHWSSTKVDFSNVIADLEDLGITERKIAELEEDLKAGLRKKPKSAVSSTDGKDVVVSQAVGTKVFVVHGHADAARLQLVAILKDELGLEPIVVQDAPNQTIETILSKIERLADECHAAIVLMTPDDDTSTGKRARQNVILELGYFLGRFRQHSTRRIVVIKNGAVEIPSDISGVIYLEYHNHPDELFLKLKKQFSHWGYKLKG